MRNHTSLASFCAFVAASSLLWLSTACSGGKPGDPENRGSFKVTGVSTGAGAVYPYRIRALDSFGNATSTVLNIESDATLKANVNANNGVLPVATLPLTAVLPDGTPGNQFLQFTFSHKLDLNSILSDQLANQTNSGLTGNLLVVAYDPTTEVTTTVPGRGFVNGYTYYNEFGNLTLTQAVAKESNGSGVTIRDVRATGFPNYPGANELVGPKVFTFVADSDSDLSTLETFPSGKLLRLLVTGAVRDNEGHLLEQELKTATTVGGDSNPPQVLGFTAIPQISPGNSQTGIDPTTSILVKFNKPVQPGEVGTFLDPTLFTPASGGLTLQVTAAAQTYEILYYADPVSFSNFCDYLVRPAYNLPGYATVNVSVNTTRIHSLTGTLVGTAIATQFSTSAGPGIVNAPVAPEAIYLGLAGATPGVSVIDLNGFGQGTGDITNTRWPLNPNIGAPGIVPALAPGTTNLDAGGAGALTLAKDTNLDTRLMRDPLLGSVADVHIGAPLDLVYNDFNINVNTTAANQINPQTTQPMPGNCIAVAPHPNPPRLIFPPPNPGRAIFGEEPTQAGGRNLLVQGNPFSSQVGQIGIYGTNQVGVFNGPAPAPTSPPPPVQFAGFNVRQQVGHFLYVLDSDNRRVLVLNSNRFTIIDTIQMPDPVDLAMSPNLQRLAVANYASSSVSFIDIDPRSPTFHQIVAVTRTSGPPVSVVWQPDGEDVLALSRTTNTITLIAGQDFTVRREVSGFLNNPIDIAVTPRFVSTGFAQGVYFAYVLNANGSIAIYESGPDGVNGIGFNDMIGTVPNANFPRARRIRYDYSSANGAVLIGHVDSSGLGVVSKLDLTSSPGQTQLNPSSGGFVLPPTFRQKEWTVVQRFGGVESTTTVHDLMSGNSVIDFTVDDLRNQGGQLGQLTPFNGGLVAPGWGHSGKDAIKNNAQVLSPRFLFVGLSDVGKVDVFELGTGRHITSIDCPGVRVVGSYWRQ